MVSRVYVPPVKPYSRAQGANNGRGPVTSATDEPPARQAAQLPREGDSADLSRSSAGLQAVQFSPNQQIPLAAVIGDFKNTMSALGADEQTRSEVTAYLNVVRLQGAKDQPEVPYIKQTLRTAANSLDQFIGKALGQPSQVVKEWVDALLMQNIDYKADLSPDVLDEPGQSASSKTANAQATQADSETNTAETEKSATATASTKTQVKNLIEAARVAQQAGNPSEADQKLQDALTLLEDANRPDWTGKVWRMRGRLLDQNGQWEQAAQAYQQAATGFEQAKLPQKQAQSLQAMASILEDHGQLEQAKTAYQQVVSLDQQFGRPEDQVRSLNDLASVTLRQGHSADAVQTLQQAVKLLTSAKVDAAVHSDIYSNLGTAHQQAQNYPEALQAYQQAMQSARQMRDRERYTSGLQQLATLYVQNNQPDEAMAALRRLKNMEARQSA
jgi:tetratricopeptide (TPR) repeat protein